MMASQGKRGIVLVACALMLSVCVGVSSAEASTYEGPGWSTPEAAVEYYLEGMKEQDITKMIGAYAVETLVDNYDLGAQVARLGMYSQQIVPALPSTNTLARDINIQSRVYEITRTVQYQTTAICLPEQDLTQPITFGSEGTTEKATAFVNDLDSAYSSVDFSTLKMVRFIEPGLISEMYLSEANQKNMKSQIAPYGGDNIRSMVVCFTMDGRVCVLFCDAVRYDDLWYLFRGNGNMGQMMMLAFHTGGVFVMDQDEVETLRVELSGDDLAVMDALLGDLFE